MWLITCFQLTFIWRVIDLKLIGNRHLTFTRWVDDFHFWGTYPYKQLVRIYWKQTVPGYSSGCIFVTRCSRISGRAPWLMDEWELDLWPKDSSLKNDILLPQYSTSSSGCWKDETPPARKSNTVTSFHSYIPLFSVITFSFWLKKYTALFVVMALKNKMYKVYEGFTEFRK